MRGHRENATKDARESRCVASTSRARGLREGTDCLDTDVFISGTFFHERVSLYRVKCDLVLIFLKIINEKWQDLHTGSRG